MVSYSKKTGMKNISVLVLFMLLFSIITGALPVSAEDAAPANGTVQEDQSILYAISKDNITTNLSGGISNDWAQARTSVVFNQEAGTFIGNTRFYTMAPAEDNPTITAYINVNTAGTYEIKMGYKHQQTPNVSVSINGGAATAVPTPSATADGKAEFWDVVGTFELKAGTNTIALTKSDNHESLGNLRMDSFLLIPKSQETVTPSPAESPASSPQEVSPEPSPSDSPVVSPGPAEIIPAEGTVQAGNSILYGIGVKNVATNIAGGFTDDWQHTGSVVIYNTENVIGTTRFYTSADVPENSSITAHIKVETAGNYIVEMGYKNAQAPEIGVKVNGGPVIKMPSASKTADDKGEFWDRAGIFAMNEGTNTIEVIKLGPGNLRMDSFRLTATDEEPTEPEASPEPSTDLIYDDGNEDVFELKNIPDILGEEQGFGTSDSSIGAFGNAHTYCNVDNSYALYTLKDAPAGVYEAYYFLPLVHSNNTDKMYIEVTDSNGKTSKHYYDILEGEGKSGENAAGDLRSNMYIKLGDDFVFNSSKPGTVKVGKDVSMGNYRVDHIKLVKLSDIAVKPFARNLTITGLLKPGVKLTASYEYVQENGYEEKDSVVKWYRGKSADGTEWTEIGQGLEYTLTDSDVGHYIKFEVTPKCDSTELNTGDTVNIVTGIIPAGDVPGTASNLILSGEETCYMPLTASYTYSDENLDPEGESVYQWYRMDTKDGARTAISGATGTCKAGDQLSYTLTPEDIGKYITVGISVKSSNLTAQEVFSNVAGPVIEMQEIAPLARMQAVVGAGGTEKPLTAFYVFEHEKGIAEGDSLIQWYVSDTYDGEYTPIAGATDKTYQPTSDQMYKYIKFEVTPVAISGWKGDKVTSEPKQIKWKMSWNDEFDYPAVDGNDPNFTKDWVSENKTNADRPNVLGGRYPENVKVEDGNLKLLQKKENKGGKEWTSGSVMTKQQFGYGYYEARYQMVAATGLNQSFWAATDPMDYMVPDKFEIDINEGHYPNTINPCIHYSVEGESGEREHIAVQGPYYPNYVNTIADDYHTFEMEWNENEIIYYMDGHRYFYAKNTMADAKKSPVNVLFSVAIMAWAGTPSDDIDGTEMKVDYFRYYQLNDESRVDKESLYRTISQAEQAKTGITIGNQVTNYPQSAVNKLEAAIAAAKAAADNANITSVQVGQAVEALNAAIEEFNSKMVLQGVLSAANPSVRIPDNFGAPITLTNTEGNFDAKLEVRENTFTSEEITITTYMTINGTRSAVEITIPEGTKFTGEADSEGYITVNLPKAANNLSGIPGSAKGIIEMGLNGISAPVRITVPNVNNYNIGYFNANGSFNAITTTVSQDRQTTAYAEVPLGGMGVINDINGGKIVWAKIISSIVVYEPKDTTPTDRPNIGGNPNPPYYPDEKPSPSPSEGPSASPSTKPTDEPADFKDIDGHWAEKEIVELAEQDIIKGVTEDEFMPDKSITRAEFTALIVRTLGLDVVDYKNEFSDVKETDWFAKEIQTALENGIISKDEMFRPNDTMTREEMTKVMVEALKNATGEEDLEKADLNQFKDAEEISGWAKEYVAEALHTGLIKGISEEEFSPKTNATRAQGAVMIHRLLGMIAKG